MRQEIAVSLKLVTPLFLHGAYPRGKAELRVPSIRGALRFWYRAALAEPDLDVLRRRETVVFGDTDRASAVRLHISGNHRGQSKAWTAITPQPPGMRYLGFSFRREDDRPSAEGISLDPPPGTIQLGLTARRTGHDLRPVLEALSALWLLQALGGLGGRSRRGFGSIEVTKIDPFNVNSDELQSVPAFLLSGMAPADLANYLVRGLARVRALLGPTGGSRTVPTYSMLQSDRPWILVLGKTWPTWSECLGAVGADLQEFRHTLDLETRVGFGLPLQRVDNLGIDRRASPLLMKVARIREGMYTAVLTFLQSDLVPNEVLPAEPDERRATARRLTEARQQVGRFLYWMADRYPTSVSVRLP